MPGSRATLRKACENKAPDSNQSDVCTGLTSPTTVSTTTAAPPAIRSSSYELTVAWCMAGGVGGVGGGEILRCAFFVRLWGGRCTVRQAHWRMLRCEPWGHEKDFVVARRRAK